jgi:hypothetical protein
VSCTITQASIINDLLDFETLKGANIAPKATQLDVDAAVHSVVRMFKHTVESKVSTAEPASQQASAQLTAHCAVLKQSCSVIVQLTVLPSD